MRKFMVVFAAIFLLAVTAYAEGISVRENIYIGDSIESAIEAEPLGILYRYKSNNGTTEILGSNRGTISGIPKSYVEYVFDDSGVLYGANFMFDSESPWGIMQTYYDHIESNLTELYGEKLGGVFGSNIGIEGYTYRFYDAYRTGLTAYPDVVGFSERVIILENYNIKVEHLLLRKYTDNDEEYIHCLAYEKFLDSEAPTWAKKKTGFVHVDNSGKFAPTIAPNDMPSGTITPESSEESIANMQKMLVAVGVLSGNFDDGIYGDETRSAISLFQRWVNSELKESKLIPTGFCDPDTFECLEFAYGNNMICPEEYTAFKLVETTLNLRGAEMLEITGATYDDQGVAVVSASSIDVRWNPDPKVDKYALLIYRIEDLTKEEPSFRLTTEEEFATIDMTDFASGTYTLYIGARNASENKINWMETIFRVDESAHARKKEKSDSNETTAESGKSEEHSASDLDDSLLDALSYDDLTKLRDDLNRRIVQAKAAQSIENSKKQTPSPAPSAERDSGIWLTKHFVDEFDMPTDDAYVTHLREIEGSFSNSAVDNRELKCRLLVSDSRKVQIFLYEYGDNLVKNPLSRSIDYKISVLDSEKNKHSLKGYYWERGDRLILSGAQCDAVIQALSLGGKVKFHIESTESLDEYQFTIEDATGFDVAYEEMMKKQNK